MRRLAERRLEAAAEVRFGDVGDRGDRGNVERLGVGPIHRVARAEQAPVEVLDIAAHAETLPEPRSYVPASCSTTGAKSASSGSSNQPTRIELIPQRSRPSRSFATRSGTVPISE
jgi:hypothetical protein